jgi:cobalt/nickel transport system permease protein
MTLTRGLSPAFRTASALIYVVVAALLPVRAWMAFSVAAAVLVSAFLASRAPLGGSARRILALEPFAVGTAALSFFQPHGAGLFFSMLSKSTLCVACVVLLSETTRFSELLDVARRARVPGPLVTTLALTYRYLFLLRDEMGRLMRARAARRFSKGRRAAWGSAAGAAAILFVRASERAERVYDAMRARGWTT